MLHFRRTIYPRFMKNLCKLRQTAIIMTNITSRTLTGNAPFNDKLTDEYNNYGTKWGYVQQSVAL